MSADTEYRHGDQAYDLLRKILTSVGAGSSGLLTELNAHAAADAAAFAALLAELTQKTEPADVQNVKGNMSIVSATFTRPADTTAYAANDVVGTNPATVMTFSNVARLAAGSGYITNVRLVKSTTTTSAAIFRLWLYSVAPAAIADNAAFTLLYANRANRLGYVDLPCTTEGAGSDSASAFVTNINLKFSCVAASRDLYGVLEAKGAYAPGNAENFWLELTADQN